MWELEAPGVQHLPRCAESGDPIVVHLLPHQWVPELLEMEPNLVLPPGVEPELEKGRVAIPLTDPIVRHRMAALSFSGDDTPSPADIRIGNVSFDGATGVGGNAVDEREIPAVKCVLGKQRAPVSVGLT
jgi:hypothetical protein